MEALIAFMRPGAHRSNCFELVTFRPAWGGGISNSSTFMSKVVPSVVGFVAGLQASLGWTSLPWVGILFEGFATRPYPKEKPLLAYMPLVMPVVPAPNSNGLDLTWALPFWCTLQPWKGTAYATSEGHPPQAALALYGWPMKPQTLLLPNFGWDEGHQAVPFTPEMQTPLFTEEQVRQMAILHSQAPWLYNDQQPRAFFPTVRRPSKRRSSVGCRVNWACYDEVICETSDSPESRAH